MAKLGPRCLHTLLYQRHYAAHAPPPSVTRTKHLHSPKPHHTPNPPFPQGTYVANLRVFDSLGASSSASKTFSVGVPSAAAPKNGGPPTTAVIDEPSPEVLAANGAGDTVQVTLDASRSAASAGARITSYVWGVVTLPGRVPVTSKQGAVAEVDLPDGLYQVG